VDIEESLKFVNIPELIRAEEIPIRNSKKRPENHEQNPENQETEQESGDFPAPFFQSEITVSLRIGIDIWNSHQAHNNESRENDAREPWVEVDQHFLQPKEVPGRF